MHEVTTNCILMAQMLWKISYMTLAVVSVPAIVILSWWADKKRTKARVIEFKSWGGRTAMVVKDDDRFARIVAGARPAKMQGRR